MKILIDPDAGFCPGVQQAVLKVEGVLQQDGKVTTLGALIHNPRELDRLQQQGMITGSQELLDDPDRLGSLASRRVFIRTHGLPANQHQALLATGARVDDGTCPIVRRVQKMVAEQDGKGFQIVIIGKKGHAEVVGLAGYGRNSIVIQDDADLENCRFHDRVAVFCQTTFDRKKFFHLADKIKSIAPQTVIHDTTCRYINKRMDLIVKFAGSVDVLILVGGAGSSNSQVLFEACCSVNKRSFKIETVHEIFKDWFWPSALVGISGGSSTPMWQLEEVKNHLLVLSAQLGQ